MKKTLLSLLAVFGLVTVQAATLHLTLEDLGSGWSSSYDPATKTITYEGDWTGRGWWLGDVDYSDYDKVVVEFEPSAMGMRLVVQYNGEAGGIDEALNGSTDVEAGATSLEVALDAAHKNSVAQIYLQCHAAGTLTLTDAYVTSSTPSETTTIWEGENNLGLDWAWDNTFGIDASKFASAKEGSRLVFTFFEDTENAQWWQFKLTDQADPSSVLTSNKGELNDWDCATMAQGATSYTVKLNASDVELLKATGLRVTGYAITVTKIELVNEIGGQEEPSTEKDLSLSGIAAIWGTGTYDAATGTVTIGGDWEGVGLAWYSTPLDASEFDEVVVKFAQPTAANGKVVINYTDNTNNGDEGAFEVGTTEVVCPLAPASKNAIMQIYLQGPAASQYVVERIYLRKTQTVNIAGVGAEKAQDNAWYTLSGVRVAAPQKGIYIHNGRKVVVK